MRRLRAWADRPLQTRGMLLCFLFMLTAVIALAWPAVGIDVDTYYAIPQGRDILRYGVPQYDIYTYLDGNRIVVQQWLWCVIVYLADAALPHHTGLALLTAATAMVLIALLADQLKGALPDPFWHWAGACLIPVLTVYTAYMITVRPQNITLILLLLEMKCLQTYQKTGRPLWLWLTVPLTLLEANLHMTMCLFHLCILLAFSVNLPFRNTEKTAIRPLKPVLLPALADALAMFINPYGVRGVLYPFLTLDSFRIFPASEQIHVRFTMANGIAALAALTVLYLALKKKGAVTSVTANMVLGFGLLALATFHSGMFLTLAAVLLVRDLCIFFRVADWPPMASKLKNSVRLLTGAASALLLAGLLVLPSLCGMYAEHTHMNPWTPSDQVIPFLKEHVKEDDSILTLYQEGSWLSYWGFRRILAPSRPEILNPGITQTRDCTQDVAWFMYGVKSPWLQKNFETPQDYFDRYGIHVITASSRCLDFPWLTGWLSENPDWTRYFADWAGGDQMSIWLYEP